MNWKIWNRRKRQPGSSNDTNKLLESATFFREQLEIAECLLAECASSEPVDVDALAQIALGHFENARNSTFSFNLEATDGRRIKLTCQMIVEFDGGE